MTEPKDFRRHFYVGQRVRVDSKTGIPSYLELADGHVVPQEDEKPGVFEVLHVTEHAVEVRRVEG